MAREPDTGIRTPDQRLRVFVSSTLGEIADERVGEEGRVEQRNERLGDRLRRAVGSTIEDRVQDFARFDGCG